MKICFLLNHFLPHSKGGTENYVYALATQLQSRGHRIKVLTPNYNTTFSKTYTYDNIEVNMFPSIGKINLETSDNKLDGFKVQIEKENPDVIHVHEIAGQEGISIDHLIMVKQLGIRLITTLHVVSYVCKTQSLMYMGIDSCDGQIDFSKCTKCFLKHKGVDHLNHLGYLLSKYSDYIPKRFIYKLPKLHTALSTYEVVKKTKISLQQINKLSDRTVALTPWMREILLLNGFDKHKTVYISQGIKVPNDMPLPSRTTTKKTIDLIYIGRINPIKGVNLLIDCISRFTNNEFQLTIYGPIINNEYAETLINKSRDFNNIRWAGEIDPQLVVDTIRNFDLFCLCTEVCEMAPLSILESFQANVPVLVSENVGSRAMVENNVNGLIFRTGDVNDLYHQLSRIIKEPYLLENLKNGVPKPKTIDTVSDEHMDLYSSLM